MNQITTYEMTKDPTKPEHKVDETTYEDKKDPTETETDVAHPSARRTLLI